MDARKFLVNFEHIASAPNGVKKLRDLILHLAVQGKLVQQDPNEKPATELLQSLKEMQKQLVNEGRSKPTRKHQNLGKPKGLCRLPMSWEWEFLAYVPLWPLKDGDWVESKDQNPNGDVRLVQLADVGDGEYKDRSSRFLTSGKAIELNCTFIEPGDVLIARLPDPLGRACIFPGDSKPCVTVVDVAICRCDKTSIVSNYLVFALNSKPVRDQIMEYATGITRKRVSTGNLGQLQIPIPPLEEQKRIANKVNELMTFCDQLEAQQTQLTETRRKANQAAIDALSNSATKKEITKCWLRIQDSFNDLNQSTEAIENLKKTIVQLSLQGRFIESTGVGPGVDELLEKIEKERDELIKQKVIKRKRPLPPMTSEPFSLPGGAIWCRLSELFIVVTDGDHQPPPKTTAGIPFLVIGNVRNGYLDFSNTRHVPESYYQNLDETRKPRKGDLLYTVVGSYGIPVHITTEEEFCVQRHIAILKPSTHMDVEYLFYVLQSRLVFDQATEVATGIAQKTVSLEGLRNILIPLYPIDQQKIIAGRIRRYSQLCDQLAGHLTQRESVHEKLILAAVHSVATKQPEMVLTVMDSKISVAAKGEISIKQWRKIPSVLIELVETMKKKVRDTVLAKLLNQHGKSMEARELWQKSGLTIDEFYATLKREITEGFIAEPEVARLKLVEVVD